MPMAIVATGRVTGGPSQLLGGDPWVVFILDPFPDTAGVRLAHACEVVCRSTDVASSVLECTRPDDRVVVSGELVIERIQDPWTMT